MVETTNKTGKVYRVFSEDGQSWVDVLRYSSVFVYDTDRRKKSQQGIVISINWTDGASEAGRTYEQVTIQPPSGSSSQPIVLNSIATMRVYHNGQDELWSFQSASKLAGGTFRTVDAIRVYNSPGTPVPPAEGIDWDVYKADLVSGSGTGDFVDFDVTNVFRMTSRSQDDLYAFNNTDITGRFIEGDAASGNYLDPFQVIVNVSFEQPPEYLIVPLDLTGDYLDTYEPASYPPKPYEEYNNDIPHVDHYFNFYEVGFTTAGPAISGLPGLHRATFAAWQVASPHAIYGGWNVPTIDVGTILIDQSYGKGPTVAGKYASAASMMTISLYACAITGPAESYEFFQLKIAECTGNRDLNGTTVGSYSLNGASIVTTGVYDFSSCTVTQGAYTYKQVGLWAFPNTIPPYPVDALVGMSFYMLLKIQRQN